MNRTNAKDTKTAMVLAALTEIGQGTTLCARVHKMGVTRGKAGIKTIYGDDLVDVLIWTGFDYRALIERSQKMLDRALIRGGYLKALARVALDQHEYTTVEDVCIALQETRDWFRKVMAGACEGNVMPTGSIWEPLKVNGGMVRGSRVYMGQDRPEDPRAPVPGTIYVQGVKLGERVVTPSANGPWRPTSTPKTQVKNIIKKGLPVGLFCQYRLEPERLVEMGIGADASRLAKMWGVGIDPDVLRHLFKIAP